MSATHRVTLYVRPYIQAFMLAKCGDATRVVHTSCGLDLWKSLTVNLGVPVLGLDNDYAQRQGRPTSQLGVFVRHPLEVTEAMNSRISLEAEETFRRDLVNYVTHMRGFTNIEKKKAIITYLEMCGVTPLHLDFQSAKRMLWKHERREAGRPVRDAPRPGRVRYK